MGKEWLYNWGGGRGDSGRSRKKGGNSTFSCSSGGDSGSVVSNSTTSTPSGCINAVIQLFDFHPFHFSSHLHHQSHDHTTFLPHDSTADVPVKGLPLSTPFNTHTHTHYAHTWVCLNKCNINCFNNRCCLLVNYAGAEAPRNSLDGTNFMEAATLSSSNLKKDETLHIEVRKEKVPLVNLLCSLHVLFKDT